MTTATPSYPVPVKLEVEPEPEPETPRQPLKSTGVLDQYEYFDLTPIIGREFPNSNVVEWLQAPNANELLRELALTISQRGVVFFRAQENLTPELQKELVQKIGHLSGKPSTSGLHIHPILNSERETHQSRDPEISTIDSTLDQSVFAYFSTPGWHSDIAYEPKPADYSSLKLDTLPKNGCGGDTLWASGTEIYDRISATYRKFLEGLTFFIDNPDHVSAAEKGGFQIYDKERGAPENVGEELKAVHPVVRTNPVTGWKSIFAIGIRVKRINEVMESESKMLIEWLNGLMVNNHDLQVRYRWGKNDLAIWDNRCTFHTGTNDYTGERRGIRAVSIGEKPFFDPLSRSRREDLASGGRQV